METENLQVVANHAGGACEGRATRLAAADGRPGDPAEAVIADETARNASQSPRNFYAVMSADERRPLGWLDGTINEQMEATGRGRSQTYEHVKVLKMRLRAPLDKVAAPGPRLRRGPGAAG